MSAAERRRWEDLQADRQTIEVGAAWLRTRSWEDGYAGFREKDRAFALAYLLEALSLQLDQMPHGFRVEAVRTARWLAEGSRSLTTPHQS